jgi:hypothetical protein
MKSSTKLYKGFKIARVALDDLCKDGWYYWNPIENGDKEHDMQWMRDNLCATLALAKSEIDCIVRDCEVYGGRI